MAQYGLWRCRLCLFVNATLILLFYGESFISLWIGPGVYAVAGRGGSLTFYSMGLVAGFSCNQCVSYFNCTWRAGQLCNNMVAAIRAEYSARYFGGFIVGSCGCDPWYNIGYGCR